MATIANSTSSCMRSFSQLIAALVRGEQEHRESMPPEKIEIEHGRFKIWSGNLGAQQSGRSSLDLRLRESFVMQTNVMKLLIELDQNLQESIQVANGSRLSLEKLPIPEYLSEDSLEDESEVKNEDGLIATELSQHMLTIMDILADLYKLSFMIRDAATGTMFLKPTLYKEIDEESKVDKFEEYAIYDHNHVVESFKQLRKDAAERMSKILSESSEEEPEGMYLVERLAITITKRRRVLRYWQRHAEKLLVAPDVPEGEKEAGPALPQSSSVPMGATAHLNASVHVAAPNLMEQSILSGTEATTCDRKLNDSPDTQSVISCASTGFDVHGNVVDLPPAPVAASRGSEFVCPYCGIVCPPQHGKNSAWRAHVLQDLQPYICTYLECSDAFQLHSSRLLWLEHERLVHRRIWRCFNHVDAVFASSEELRNHFQSKLHNFTKAQIKNLLDVCESSVKDTRTKCPICLEGPFEKGLKNHLSFHLEKFATFSVPRGNFSGDESEYRADCNSEKVQGLRSDISRESISLSFRSPSASTSSCANKDPKDETRLEHVASTAPDDESVALHSVCSGSDLTLKDDSDLAGRQNSLDSRPEEVIRVAQRAANVTPKDHLDSARCLYDLSDGLGDRYHNFEDYLEFATYLSYLRDRLGDPYHDLDGAIRVDQLAVEVMYPDLASYLVPEGKLEAEKVYQDAIERYEKAVGAQHTSTLGRINGLGNPHRRRYPVVKVEEMYERALEGNEKALGLEHTSTLDIVSTLGLVYRDQGKLDEAEKMYERALQGYEKALGPEHTSTFDTFKNLGYVYWSWGKLDGAEKMYEWALQGYQKAKGMDHTSTLDIVKRLGLLYSKQGKPEEAEAMYRRALLGYEKAYGPDHPSVLDIFNILSQLYRDHQGKVEEAEDICERALRRYEKAYGLNHPSTLDMVNNLAESYKRQGKFQAAERINIRALNGIEVYHPGRRDIVPNLDHVGKLEEAEYTSTVGKEKA